VDDSAGRWPPPPAGTWVVDLDGVVWLTDEPVPGSAEAVSTLRRAGVRVLFATNNSQPTLAELVGRLERVGIEATADDLVTSGQAAAAMLAPGTRALVLGGGGVVESLTARGVEVVETGPVDAVVVGWTRRFDFDRLDVAAAAVRAGAVLVGTNDDPTFPAPGRLLPGAGALLAAVATASGVVPEVAGKPHRAVADLIARRSADLRATVGDRPSTDGELARLLGVPYALVLSGVTDDSRARSLHPPADAVAPDLGSLVASLRW
jgi:glycerol-1-phosphatase